MEEEAVKLCTYLIEMKQVKKFTGFHGSGQLSRVGSDHPDPTPTRET